MGLNHDNEHCEMSFLRVSFSIKIHQSFKQERIQEVLNSLIHLGCRKVALNSHGLKQNE